MNPQEHYQKLISSITDIDKRMLARVISYHIGKTNAIPKRALVAEVFGEYTDSNDRKAREIIASLVKDDHYPICALSGTGGYYLAASHDEAVENAREIESRIEELSTRAKALRLCTLPAVPPEDRARQAQTSLF
jgi:hypothetical protein